MSPQRDAWGRLSRLGHPRQGLAAELPPLAQFAVVEVPTRIPVACIRLL